MLVSHGAIEVVGTRFSVTQEEQRGEVRLDEGSIRFQWTGGAEVMLSPGETLVWPPRPTPAPVMLDPIQIEEPDEELVAPPKPPAQPRVQRIAPLKQAVTPEEDPAGETPTPDPDAASGPMLMEDVLKPMSTLRSQHRYREAMELLRAQLDRSDFTGLQQARLSFEIGLLLQDRMDDKAGACAHWKQHARRYPDDASHADRVQEYIGVCEEAP